MIEGLRPATPASTPSVARIGDDIPSLSTWKALDAELRELWDTKLGRATETEIRHHSTRDALIFLPFPFLSVFDLQNLDDQMFAWDTYFVDRALIAHERLDLVRDHIRNYLFMIDRYGHMPNANHTSGLTRSQTPVFPDGIWRYYLASGDRDLLVQALPLLTREYQDYWCAPHHQTPIGLATNRDLGDPDLTPQMAAEAETGLDWTPIYGGDVRRCVPLITNCALVRYAQVLALITGELGFTDEAATFSDEAVTRAKLINTYCWDDDRGLFVEYDYVAGEQLPYVSACTLWPLWAGHATPDQARRVVEQLPLLEQRYGLAATDRVYADPHPAPPSADVHPDLPAEVVGGLGQLQWMYPAGWGCIQLVAAEGLDAYGYSDVATRISAHFLAAVLRQYENTGRLWEKYNTVDGGLELPNSRYGNMPFLSWTAGAAVSLGRRLFLQEPLRPVGYDWTGEHAVQDA